MSLWIENTVGFPVFVLEKNRIYSTEEKDDDFLPVGYISEVSLLMGIERFEKSPKSH